MLVCPKMPVLADFPDPGPTYVHVYILASYALSTKGNLWILGVHENEIIT